MGSLILFVLIFFGIGIVVLWFYPNNNSNEIKSVLKDIFANFKDLFGNFIKLFTLVKGLVKSDSADNQTNDPKDQTLGIEEVNASSSAQDTPISKNDALELNPLSTETPVTAVFNSDNSSSKTEPNVVQEAIKNIPASSISNSDEIESHDISLG